MFKYSKQAFIRAKPLIVLISLGILLSSCGTQKEKQKSGDQSRGQDLQMALSILSDIESTNEKVILSLNGPAAVEAEDAQQQGQKENQEQQKKEVQGTQSEQPGGQQGQQSQQPGGQQSQQPGGQQSQQPGGQQGQQSQQPGGQQGQQSQQPGGQQGQQSQQPQESQQPGGQQGQQSQQQAPDWKSISASIVEMHTMLNEYLPLATKLGSSSELNNGASDTLNRLTEKAEGKDSMAVLVECNNLFNYMADYYAIFQEKSAPLKKILFYARGTMLASMNADWQTSQSAMKELMSLWQAHKPTLMQDQKDSVSQLDLAITDLDKVVREKNQNLVHIKGGILMKNTAELEKSMKEQKQSAQ